MKKPGKIYYGRSLLGILTLMSSSTLLMTAGVHASTVSVADMEKDMHYKEMHHTVMAVFSDESISDGDSNYSDTEDSNSNNSEHGFSPFCCSDKPYGLVKNGREWKPRWFNDDDSHYTPFASSIPPGLEKYGHEWKPLLFRENCTVVPVPAAVWLFGTGLVGLAGIARRKNRRQ